MKKFLSILLAAMMVLAMTSAFAVDEYTITVPAASTTNNVTHTYNVYQIFTGTLGDGKELGELKWGANAELPDGVEVDDAVTETQLAALKGLSTDAKDAAIIAVVKNYVDLDSTPMGPVTSGNTLTVEPGYYLIADANTLNGQDEAATTYLVKVCADLTIAPKTAKPTVDKQVQDEAEDGENDKEWGETADHEINESFQFKLVATLTADEDYESYTTYKVVFTDTMSNGVTFDSIDKVTVDDVEVDYDECTADEGQAGGSWSLTINNILGVEGIDLSDGAQVVVTYNAHLNENAYVTTGSATTTENKNTVYLEYSNNPYIETSMGKTPEDHVWVYTYQVLNTKYDGSVGDTNKMAGAGFTLYDSTGAAVLLIKIADGSYVVANQNTVVEVDTENAGQYKNADEEAEDDNVYVYEMISSSADANKGQFDVKGLDHGTYTLKETKVPSGYNKCDDITIVIDATHSEKTEGNASELKMEQTTANMNNNVINDVGATLPETGGIGTTLFYLFGSIMAAGSALILVVRRRAEAEEE